MPTSAPESSIGFRSERGPVLSSLMLSTSLVALDSTIVATAVPSIVSDLGGFSAFPWLFSVYLLAQAVSVPVYGKLADLFGRNRSCCSVSGCSCSGRSCAVSPGTCRR